MANEREKAYIVNKNSDGKPQLIEMDYGGAKHISNERTHQNNIRRFHERQAARRGGNKPLMPICNRIGIKEK